MALYATPAYRMGFEGFLASTSPATPLVTPSTVTDPSEPSSSAATYLGWMRAPGWSQNENYTTDGGAGSMKDEYAIPGVRECAVNTEIMVADFSAFKTKGASGDVYTAVRKHALTGTGEGGLVKGLQLMHLFLGAGSNYGDGFGKVGLDALLNSLSFTIEEGRMVTAQVEWWPIAFLAMTTPLAQHTIPTGTAAQPLYWGEVTWTVGSTDYKPILGGMTINLGNNLRRQGMRATLSSPELAISRTPFKILPGKETVRASYRLHDKLPAALDVTSDWSTVTARAEQPGSGAGRCFLQVAITHSFKNNYSQAQAQAGEPLSFSGDTASFGVLIDAGLTTA